MLLLLAHNARTAVAEPLEWSRWAMPYPRTNHVAILDPTRDRLLIHGGTTQGPNGDSDELWGLTLGATPQWQWLGYTQPTSGMLARSSHHAIFDTPGDRVVVFGGEIDGTTLSDTWRLTPATSAWASFGSGSPPTNGWERAAAFDALRRRMVVLSTFGVVHALDLASGAWSTVTTSGTTPAPYFRFAAYDSNRDRIISTTTSNETWALTLAGTPTWSLLTPVGGPPPSLDGGIVYDAGRDQIELVLSDDTVWRLTLAGTPQWTLLSSAPLPPGPRSSTAIAHDPARDRLVLHGAAGSNDTWAFGLTSHVWTQIQPGNPIPLRTQHSAIVDPAHDAMLVFGGGGTGNDTWRFALDGSGFTALATAGTLPSSRSGHAAIHDPVRGRMLVFGGKSGATYLNDVQVLTLSGTPTWSTLATAGTPPTARSGAAAVYDPVRDRMLVFAGGNDGTFNFKDVWALTLSGTPTWTQLVDGDALPGLYPGAAAAYDSRHDRLIAVGTQGEDGGTYGWALPLAGSPEWVPLAFGAPTAQRFNITAAYDSLNDRVLVYGGLTSDGTATLGTLLALGTGPGGNWSVVGPSGSAPLPRSLHTFVRDAVHGRFIMFGGRETGAFFTDPLSGAWTSPSLFYLTDAAALVSAPTPSEPSASLALTSCRFVTRDRLGVAYRLAEAGESTLEVLDVQGRRLGRWSLDRATAGTHEATLQLSRGVGAGLCMVVLRQGANITQRKVLVVH